MGGRLSLCPESDCDRRKVAVAAPAIDSPEITRLGLGQNVLARHKDQPASGLQIDPDPYRAVHHAVDTLPPNDLASLPCVIPRVLTPDECAKLIATVERERAFLHALGTAREGYRRASSWNVYADSDTRWLYDVFEEVALFANERFDFKLTGFREPLFLARYEVGGLFKWHSDFTGGITSTRKISITIQLSAPEEYTGGGLEFSTMGELPFSRLQGTAIAFPSFLSHRVTPVETGVRRVVVAWVHGETFR